MTLRNAILFLLKLRIIKRFKLKYSIIIVLSVLMSCSTGVSTNGHQSNGRFKSSTIIGKWSQEASPDVSVFEFNESDFVVNYNGELQTYRYQIKGDSIVIHQMVNNQPSKGKLEFVSENILKIYWSTGDVNLYYRVVE